MSPGPPSAPFGTAIGTGIVSRPSRSPTPKYLCNFISVRRPRRTRPPSMQL
jgi:hypothetical protein